MEFGVQFFPSLGPDRKSPAHYWDEALELTRLGEELGYGHVRTVEHISIPTAAIVRTR
jgi:hypothetical protein